MLLKVPELHEPLAQAVAAADDAGMVPDEVAQLVDELLRTSFAASCSGREDVEGCEVLLCRPLVERNGRQQVIQDIREMSAEDLPEDDGLGQGVPPKPVGAMDAGGRLADGEEPLDSRGARPRVDLDAAHAVVGGGGHLHGLLRYVHPLLHELLVHVWQPVLDVAGVAMGDVEQNRPVGGATALPNLAV